MNMPQGLGRYGVEENSDSYVALGENDDPNAVFEWYLKNHLGSTMLVYGTQSVSQPGMADFGLEKAAYDYRAFGEQMSIVEPADKVTENFTGKELDDEIALNYFGARYLDPMLGMWISVDANREYSNLYSFVGYNPIISVDPDGNATLSLGVAASASVGPINVSISFSILYNTNAKNWGDRIMGSFSARSGAAVAVGTSGRVRVGYSPEDSKTGISHALVNSVTTPVLPGVVMGINESNDIKTGDPSYSFDLGLGSEFGVGAVQPQTTVTGSLGDLCKGLTNKMNSMMETDYTKEDAAD